MLLIARVGVLLRELALAWREAPNQGHSAKSLQMAGYRAWYLEAVGFRQHAFVRLILLRTVRGACWLVGCLSATYFAKHL